MPVTNYCYYCGKPATNVEHIPPKCIFFGNIDGDENRLNLITVPSCEEHNSGKQKDDEYLRFVLVMSIRSSGIVGNLSIDNFIRATQRTPYVFSSFIRNPSIVNLHSQGERPITGETISYEADVERYHRILKQICIGLFYFTYQSVFVGKIDIAYDGTLSLDDETINKRSEGIRRAFIPIEATEEYIGDNPNIFKYKTSKNGNAIYMKLVFFNTNEILARMKIEET